MQQNTHPQLQERWSLNSEVRRVAKLQVTETAGTVKIRSCCTHAKKNNKEKQKHSRNVTRLGMQLSRSHSKNGTNEKKSIGLCNCTTYTVQPQHNAQKIMRSRCKKDKM